MKKILCCITLMTQSLWANPQTIVQSMLANDVSYYSFISLNQDKYITFTENYINNLKQAPEHEKIRQLFLTAENHYYEQKFYQAKIKYLEVIGLYNKFHSNNHGKELILKSLTKLIELSHNKKNIKRYKKLKNGGAFPLYQQKKKGAIWTVPQSLEKFNTLIINGDQYEIYPEKKIRLPAENFIMTLVSNQFNPITVKINRKELKQWSPQLTWLYKAPCDFAKKNSKQLKWSTYFSDECIVTPGAKVKYTPLAKLKFAPTPTLLNTNTQVSKPSVWYKNKWLWVGVSAALTAAVIHTQQKKGAPKSNTTTKTGF